MTMLYRRYIAREGQPILYHIDQRCAMLEADRGVWLSVDGDGGVEAINRCASCWPLQSYSKPRPWGVRVVRT